MLTDLQKLLAHTEQNISLPTVSLGPEHDYACLPLCVIDAVYSIGVNYTGTKNTVVRWCEYHHWPRLRTETNYEYTISEFLDLMNRFTCEELAERVFRNRQRTSARSGVLKSAAVREFAEVLQSERVERLSDMRSDGAVARVEPRIKQIKGQSSGISFDYFMILAGSDEYIKADRMICRFVADALRSNSVKPREARDLFLSAANVLRRQYPNVTPRALDHAVWDFQRGRQPANKMLARCGID